MKAEVRVSKTGQAGTPLVEVAINSKATPEDIGNMVKSVYSSAAVYRAGGIRECLTCKSGIHVAVVEDFGDSITVESGK
jgi:deoxyribose-phosphate aldolase